MAVRINFEGQAVQDVAVSTERGMVTATRPQLKEWGANIPLQEALFVFRVSEDKPGEAIEAAKRFDLHGPGLAPHLVADLESDELQAAVAIYRQIRTALENDGTIDTQEALGILKTGLAKVGGPIPAVVDFAGSFAGQLLGFFQKGKGKN